MDSYDQPKWKYHPLCLLFPAMTKEERAELKKDMLERAMKGLDPLEHAIWLYMDMILDGRHRFDIWYELAEENACNGYFRRNRPPTEVFDQSKHGTLGAWLKVKSLNLVHRHVPADQKVAIFLEAAEQFPEVKAAIEEIKEENAARKKAGKAAGDQRGNTAKEIGKLAGAGATTVKLVDKLKKDAPEKFEEVVAGKTSAKKALKEVEEKNPKPPKSKPSPAKPKEIQAGDTVFQVVLPSDWSGVPSVAERTIKKVAVKNFVCGDGRINKGDPLSLSLEAAKKAWRAVMEKQIGKLKEAVKTGPTIGKGK